MSGAVQVRKTGPRTYTPAADATITGMQLVEARAASRVGVAAAGSVKVLGVALNDAIGPELLVTTPTTVNGHSVLNAVVLPTAVAVADSGIEVPVIYAAAAAFGDKLIAAALGKVTPAGATPDARTIVGTCTEPAGISGADIVGLMRTA